MKHRKNKKITILLLLLLIVTAGASVFVIENRQDDKTVNYIEENTPRLYGLTARNLLDSITVGYNIGHSLDSCPECSTDSAISDTAHYETYYGNPVIEKEFFAAIKSAGFNAVRLPVSWSCNTSAADGHLIIRSAWLDRVAQVVDYAIACDLFVILNSHNDSAILWADMEDIEKVSGNLRDLWSQIAERFQGYDEKLIFESFNEISSKDQSPQFKEGSAQAANILNQLFVDTVRAEGGFNKSRILICDTYMSETTDAILNAFELPSDTVPDRLAISVHSYNPSYNQDIRNFFETLGYHAGRLGAPIIITEFGTTNSFIPADYRSNHAGNYVACADEYGIKCFWWDDGDRYKLFDRQTNEPVYEDIIESLMNPAEFKTNKVSTTAFDSIESYSYASLSPLTGMLQDAPDGALTLNPDKKGFPVLHGYGYHIRLNAFGNGEGLCLSGLCFYDAHQNFIEY